VEIGGATTSTVDLSSPKNSIPRYIFSVSI